MTDAQIGKFEKPNLENVCKTHFHFKHTVDKFRDDAKSVEEFFGSNGPLQTEHDLNIRSSLYHDFLEGIADRVQELYKSEKTYRVGQQDTGVDDSETPDDIAKYFSQKK